MDRTATAGHRALRRYRHSLPHHAYHVTSCTLGRSPVFTGPAAFVAARCFGTPRLWGDATVLAWVLMPDHAHWLVQLGAHDGLALVVNRIKSASSRVAGTHTKATRPVWAAGYYERHLRAPKDLSAVAAYIIHNPVRAGLVTRPGDYPFWDTVYT